VTSSKKMKKIRKIVYFVFQETPPDKRCEYDVEHAQKEGENPDCAGLLVKNHEFVFPRGSLERKIGESMRNLLLICQSEQ
jgi:hypothetical protein